MLGSPRRSRSACRCRRTRRWTRRTRWRTDSAAAHEDRRVRGQRHHPGTLCRPRRQRSTAFTFSNIPGGTVSFAIVLQYLDVAANGPDGVLDWLAWNIPVKAAGIPEGSLPEGAIVRTAGVGRGELFWPGRASRSSVPSLRLRALRAERHAEPSCRRHTRAAPRRNEGHHRRQSRVRRPLPSASWRLSQRTFSRSATISCEPSSVPPRRILATSIAVRPMSSSASGLAP